MDWDPNLPLWSLVRVWCTFSCYCDWFCVAKTWELLCLRNIYGRVFSSHMSSNSLNWLCILSFWTLVSDKECFAMSSFPHWYQACNLCTTVWDMWLLLHCELLQQKFRTKNLEYAFADFEQVSYQHTSSLAADEVVSAICDEGDTGSHVSWKTLQRLQPHFVFSCLFCCIWKLT